MADTANVDPSLSLSLSSSLPHSSSSSSTFSSSSSSSSLSSSSSCGVEIADPTVKVRKDELTIGVHGHDLKWWNADKVKTTFLEAGIKVVSVDKAKGKMFAFVTFGSSEDKIAGQTAISSLTDKKGKTCFRIKEAGKGTSAKFDKREQWKNESKESYRKRHAEKKEKEMTNEDDNSNKKPKIEKERTIEDQVTPFWKMPYDEQLTTKQQDMERVVRKWCFEMKKFAPEIKVEADGFEVATTVPSPSTEGYRNKCTFAIGVDGEGRPVTGFTLGRFGSEGSHTQSPDKCLHIPEIAKKCAGWMTSFVRDRFPDLSVYDKASHIGFWRMLQVRNTSREVMITVQFHPGFASEQTQTTTFEEMTKFFRAAFESESLELSSVQVQSWEGVSNAAPDDLPTKVLYGADFITQDLLGLQFRISSNSFFQVNTPATEKLYTLVGDWCELTPGTLLLDVCCGAGTIGLTLARRVSQVIGFEVVPDAVEDAKANAVRNGVTNASFVCGKAEDTIRQVVESLGDKQQHVVAIVDPPRAGLHFEVVNALRKCRLINTIVFVMCNPRQCFENMKRFLGPRSKSVRTPPFVMVKVIPVDLFPHTNLTELVVLLQREKDELDPTVQ